MIGQPLNEPNRLAALQSTGLLDSLSEETFDRFTRLAARLLSCPVSLISLVDQNRQFFKSQIGLPEPWATKKETPLDYSFCQHVVTQGEPLVISDATENPLVQNNLAIPELGVRAYMGVPIRSDDGYILGAFCAINSREQLWKASDLAALEDLGQALASEIRLRERTKAMQKLLEEQAAHEAEQDKLVHLLVHDLRSPLSAIQAGLELLALELPKSAGNEHELLALSQSGSEELQQLIDQILEVYRMRSGKLIVQSHPVKLNALLRSVFAQMMPAFEAGSQTFLVKYFPEEVEFMADRGLLRRVLFNLLSNANKYAGPGAQIRLHGTAAPDGITLEVSDTGPGIPNQFKDSVFEFFNRGDTKKRGVENSYGLGLAFCRLVAEAHNGTLELYSPPSGGCCFRFHLRQES